LQGIETVREFQHHFIHEDLLDLSAELDQYARQVMIWESTQYLKEGRHFRWRDVTLRPLALFLICYFKTGGFKEGFRGFYLSAYRAFYSFMIYARLYEMEIKRGLKE
jgi:hypothetical protein